MRESIGGAWLYGLVVVFVLLFSGFLAVAINYTKVFRVKNEIISFIEREEGLTSNAASDPRDWGALQLIDNFLVNAKYNTRGFCPSDYKGYSELGVQEVNRTSRYLYCIKRTKSNYNDVYFYDVILFFRIDLPVFGEIFTFKVEGQTSQVIYPADYYIWD